LKPFLLEGESTVEGLKLQPGDYVTLNLSSVHQASLTKTGCLFMLWACEQDEGLRCVKTCFCRAGDSVPLSVPGTRVKPGLQRS
jgi:hypothetical protein